MGKLLMHTPGSTFGANQHSTAPCWTNFVARIRPVRLPATVSCVKRLLLTVSLLLFLTACEDAVRELGPEFGIGVHREITTSRLLADYGPVLETVVSLADSKADSEAASMRAALDRKFSDDSAVLEISFYGPCCGRRATIESAYNYIAADFGLLQKSCGSAHFPGQDDLMRCDWRNTRGQEWDVLRYRRYEEVDGITWLLKAEFDYAEIRERVGP